MHCRAGNRESVAQSDASEVPLVGADLDLPDDFDNHLTGDAEEGLTSASDAPVAPPLAIDAAAAPATTPPPSTHTPGADG